MASQDVNPELCDLSLPHPLREYQWQGVRFLVERTSALLADDMGLGKTVQVSVALSLLHRRVDVNRVLVIAPAALKLNWERELCRWAPKLSIRRVTGGRQERLGQYRLPYNVLVASYEQVRDDAELLANEVLFDVVVLDEAQRIKNSGSRTAVACRTVQRQRSWALTGTPLENNTKDLVSVFRFVRPRILHNALTRDETHRRMQPFFLRRVKTDVFEQLPPIMLQDVPLELTEKQQRAYDGAWNQRLIAKSDGELLAVITQLKQVCNFDATSGESCKLEALRTVLEGLAEGSKVLIFSQYVQTLVWLQAKLSRDSEASGLYHGGLNEFAKDQLLQRFRTKSGSFLLLMSLTAGATGLNLQEADVVVFFDRWWNPAVENQAIHRAYRFGRDRPLLVFRFLVAATIEERIDEILREKARLFSTYIDEATSAEVPPLTGGELRRVLDLRDSRN